MRTEEEIKLELEDLVYELKQQRDYSDECVEEYDERMIQLRSEIYRLEWVLNEN